MNTDLKILSVEPYFSDEIPRTPLKFGAVVVDRATLCWVKVQVENGRGQQAEGWGGIPIGDSWAFPSKAVPHEERDPAMRQIVREFCQLASEYTGHAHPIDIYLDLEGDLRQVSDSVSQERKLKEPMPFLGALVCACPLDAALHDGFGNVNGIPSYDGYGPDFMEHDLSRYLGADFKGKYIADYIRDQYLPQIPIFHLVGGLDKLRKSEVDESDPQDGLPNSLDEWVERDGLICLKVKLRGNDLNWDVERTKEVVAIAHEVQDKQGKNELHFTADTNEQCESPDYIIEMLARLKEEYPQAFEELLYVEQPTERDLTAHRFDMRELAKIKPVIIDESLTSLEDFDLAMELGWSGIALKTCKCQSMELLMVAKAEQLGIPYAVQDLTNPGISLIHSVGFAARINTMKGVEANARQFFPSSSEPEAKVHPDLFRVRDGMASTASLIGTGLGYQMERIERKLG